MSVDITKYLPLIVSVNVYYLSFKNYYRNLSFLLLYELYHIVFFQIFQLSEMLHNALETIDCCIIIIGTIVTLYLNFYVGQKLLDHGNAIFDEL